MKESLGAAEEHQKPGNTDSGTRHGIVRRALDIGARAVDDCDRAWEQRDDGANAAKVERKGRYRWDGVSRERDGPREVSNNIRTAMIVAAEILRRYMPL
jgi:hypothetical protein